MSITINNKLNDSKPKHIIYPIDYVYIGRYPRTITKNGITFKYYHYDCFIGNDEAIRYCTKYKRVTGNYIENYFELEKPVSTFLEDTKNDIVYTLIESYDILYTFNGNVLIQYAKLRAHALSKSSLRKQYLKNKAELTRQIKARKTDTLIENEFESTSLNAKK